MCVVYPVSKEAVENEYGVAHYCLLKGLWTSEEVWVLGCELPCFIIILPVFPTEIPVISSGSPDLWLWVLLGFYRFTPST